MNRDTRGKSVADSETLRRHVFVHFNQTKLILLFVVNEQTRMTRHVRLPSIPPNIITAWSAKRSFSGHGESLIITIMRYNLHRTIQCLSILAERETGPATPSFLSSRVRPRHIRVGSVKLWCRGASSSSFVYERAPASLCTRTFAEFLRQRSPETIKINHESCEQHILIRSPKNVKNESRGARPHAETCSRCSCETGLITGGLLERRGT